MSYKGLLFSSSRIFKQKRTNHTIDWTVLYIGVNPDWNWKNGSTPVKLSLRIIQIRNTLICKKPFRQFIRNWLHFIFRLCGLLKGKNCSHHRDIHFLYVSLSLYIEYRWMWVTPTTNTFQSTNLSFT